MPDIFSTSAWAFFKASSGVIVPATALESSMPSAFSISGHLGCRGRGFEKLMASISVGKCRNFSCEVSSGSVKTEKRTGGLPRVAEILICSGDVAQTMKSNASCLFFAADMMPIVQCPISEAPAWVPEGMAEYEILPTIFDWLGSSKVATQFGQLIDEAAVPAAIAVPTSLAL